jgi:UDP-GlcNAc:undecaprenyl-phosphate GlcNAc-1-phosphate transferase
MELILSFILALSLSMLMLPALMRHAAEWGLVDIPNARKQHAGPIPRVGGIAIAMGTLLSATMWSFADAAYIGFLAGSVVIVLFGLLDDRYNLDYRIKFGGQIIAAVIVVHFGTLLHSFPFLSGELSYGAILVPVTILVLLSATNAFNLLDGLDGLAAGCGSLSLAAIGALSLAYVHDGSLTLVIAAALGGILGFLRFNTHPAVVYMGDAGSQFLGFSIGTLAVLLVERSNGMLSPAVVLPILGLPIIDTLMVMTIRIRNGRSPFAPDRNHIHHRLLSIGLNHHEAVAAIYLVQATLVASAIVFREQSDLVIISAYIAICLVSVLAYFGFSRLRIRAFEASSTGSTIDAALRSAPQSRTESICAFLTRYVEYSTLFYLIGGALLVKTVTLDMSVIALCGAVVLLTTRLWQRAAVPTVRLASYLAVMYVSYLSCLPTASPWLSSTLFHIWLASVAIAVSAVIFLAPPSQFQLSTQDLLAVIVVVGFIALPIAVADKSLAGAVAVRALVFIYACELLIVLRSSKTESVSLAAIVALFVMAILRAAPEGWGALQTLLDAFD